jgi:hypothetical protein
MVRSSVIRVPEAAALFYDELTRVIEQGDVDRKIKVSKRTGDHKSGFTQRNMTSYSSYIM